MGAPGALNEGDGWRFEGFQPGEYRLILVSEMDGSRAMEATWTCPSAGTARTHF
jgi:hypothetical protein